MADKKPEKKGDKKAPPAARPIEIIVAEIVIIGGLLLGFIFLISSWIDFDAPNGGVRAFFIGLLSSVQVLSTFVSLLFIMGIIYAKFKMGQVDRSSKLRAKVKAVEEKKVIKQQNAENKKWKKVLEHVGSENSSDWRLAILEADILLGDLLTKMGYKGEGIGEQLKSIEKGDLQSLDEAWEAHKVRNSIAHEGAEFPLNHREAKRVIGLFEVVFRELFYI